MIKTPQLKLVEGIVDHMQTLHYKNDCKCPGCLDSTQGINKQSECDCGGLIHLIFEPSTQKLYEICDTCMFDYFKKVAMN